MYYSLYKITNLVNGKIYIGVHRTENLDDGYMGSGASIKAAIKKHGRDNFNKEILQLFDNEEAMFEAEAFIVNSDFVTSSETYNLITGGLGGSSENGKFIGSWYRNKMATDPEFNAEMCKRISERSKRLEEEGRMFPNGTRGNWKRRKNSPETRQKLSIANTGKKHSEETKRKISEAQVGKPRKMHSEESKKKMSENRKGNASGVNNQNFGKCWIHNLELRESKMIPRKEIEQWYAEGWKKGRKSKFPAFDEEVTDKLNYPS